MGIYLIGGEAKQYLYTVFFGNVDNQYDSICKENAELIDAARAAAFQKIISRMQMIAGIPGLTNQQKWEEFLNLNLNDI